MAKAGLSWTDDVASQSKPRCWVLSLGESVGKLLHGAEVLASAVAEVYQSEASEGEGVHLWSQSFGVSNGEGGRRGSSWSCLLYEVWAETEGGERLGVLK